MSDDIRLVAEAAHSIVTAISRRDVAALRPMLAPGFLHREHGGIVSDAAAFLGNITTIPGEIRFVKLMGLRVDLTPAGALVTGMQHAQVVVKGETIDDVRGFVDWFVKIAGQWRIQSAVDFPSTS